MKKILLILSFSIAFFLFSNQSFSQQYQQPQWLMPFYFQDANGDRDTIYIGYDPSANPTDWDIDPLFGEKWIWIDTSVFNAYVMVYPGFSGDGYITSDSVTKRTITSITHTIMGYYHPLGFSFTQGKFPITIKWDNELLNSPDLPVQDFPDISPRPRARVDMECSNFETNYFLCPYDNQRIVLTDTCIWNFWQCYKDSIVLFGSNNYPPWDVFSGLMFSIVPHNLIITDIKDVKAKTNPFQVTNNANTLLVCNNTPENYQWQIISTAGVVLKKGEENAANSRQTINFSALHPGMYLLAISNYKNKFFYKFINLKQ